MKVTEVKVFVLENSDKTKAMASITLDGAFVVKGLKVLEGQKGLFVSMPSRKKQDGDYEDICFALDGELRQAINDAVLAKYQSQAKFGK